MTLLQHIRIPSTVPRFPTYALAVELQTHLQRRLLEHKAALGASSSPSSASSSSSTTSSIAPPPSLISFTPAPTYTLGRRQVGPLAPAEAQRLRAPLRVGSSSSSQSQSQSSSQRYYAPEVVSAPRGGLATYHGPGQLVFWPVIDLHSPYHRHFTVRDYACLLEKTTIAALARVTKGGGKGAAAGVEVKGFTTDNPGVWVRHNHNASAAAASGVGGEDRKIAALGVHLRRHVTGLGVAVNVHMPVQGPEEINPWSRIVACGLEDKGVTNLVTELYGVNGDEEEQNSYTSAGQQLEDELRQAWADEFTERLCLKTDSPAGYTEDAALSALISSFEKHAQGLDSGHSFNAGLGA
ncbi:hypothetical protein G7054_g5124 [Neopestalotiopsis clavispora]|nr:hypothetical protein G7054_g5124 [Neopestalotiopsis clavispora]